MKLTLIAVGRLKTPAWTAAQKDYLERIRHYSSVTLLETKDRPDIEKEGEDLLRAAGDAPALIALTPRGKLFDSPAWAAKLSKLGETYQRLTFVIGGPNGLSQSVVQKSRLELALSPMTFPHEMARVVFLEQLYRAFTILGGEKYHK